MRRFSLPLTLLAVAAGVLLMAQFIGMPVHRVVAEDSASAAPSGPLGTRVRIEGVDVSARSGRVDYPRLSGRIQRMMLDPEMVGLAVAVVENGRITYLGGFGETARGSGERVTPETVFRWASLSKGVAATMVAMLAEQGQLSLDEPVSRYAPSLRLPNANQTRVTVANLLAHQLGIGRNSQDPKLEDGENPAMLRMQLATLEPGCPPGTCHSYQNVAFDAASEIVAGRSNASYEEALHTRLFAPLGMLSATTTREGLVRSPSWAHPHVDMGREVEVLEPYYRVPAAGGMNGSIVDLAVWMEAQMGLAPEVLSPGLLDTIHRPRVRTEREDRRNRRYQGRLSNAHYALGWRLYDYNGHRVIGHRGAVSGYRSLVMFDPETRNGVVVLWNSESRRPYGLPMDIFDMLYGLPDADWTAAPEPEGAAHEEEAPVREGIAISSGGRRRPGASFEAPPAR